MGNCGGSIPLPSSMKQCDECGFTYEWYYKENKLTPFGTRVTIVGVHWGWQAYCGCPASRGGRVRVPVNWEPVWILTPVD